MKLLSIAITNLLLLSSLISSGQETPAATTGTKAKTPAPAPVPNQETIEYDFLTNKFILRPNCIKEGASVILIYKGLNKFALTSNSSMVSGNRSYEDGLAQLQAGMQKIAAGKEIAGDQIVEDTKKTGKTTAKEIKVIDSLERYLNNKIAKLDEIETEFNNINQDIIKVNSIMSMDKQLIAAANDYTLNTKADLQNFIFLQSASSGVSSPADYTTQLQATVKAITNSLSAIRKKMNEMRDNSERVPEKLRKEEKDKLEKLFSEIEARLKNVEAAYSGVNLKTLQDNAADMSQRAFRLLNQDFTLPAQTIGTADGDYIEISDKLNDNSGKLVREFKPFKIPTYGGWRIDFSVGISINIGGHGEYSYDLRKNPTNATSGSAVDSVILLSDDEDRLFQFSPAIFVHWYKTSCKSIQWSLTTGLTPDFSNLSESRLSIGLGMGLISSNEFQRRIMISGGVSLGFADVLKTKYKDLKDYRQFGDLDPDELTKKALKPGFFIGVSYNLGGAGH